MNGQLLKVSVQSLMSGVVNQLPLWYHLAVYRYCFALILYFYKFISNSNLLTH